jgi:N-methylhydantoinase B
VTGNVPAARADVSSGRRIDDNLVEVTTDGARRIACAHCGQVLGDRTDGITIARYQGPSAEAGPQVMSDPAAYVDADVVFRQYSCPGCYAALYSAVVPASHRDHLGGLTRLGSAG